MQTLLVRKDPEPCRRFFPHVPDDLPHVLASPTRLVLVEQAAVPLL